MVKKFSKALDESFKNKLPAQHNTVLNKNNTDNKKQMEALVINNITMSYITMALSGNKALYMVEEVKTEEFSGGIVYKLIFLLLDEYWPEDIIGAAKNWMSLWNWSWTMGKAPKNLGGCMTRIVNKYQTKSDEGQKVATIHKRGVKQ